MAVNRQLASEMYKIMSGMTNDTVVRYNDNVSCDPFPHHYDEGWGTGECGIAV